MSNADEWRVYPEELARRCKDSESAIRSQLKALENAKYIRTYRKSFGGRYGTEAYRFCSDRKISDEAFNTLKAEQDLELEKLLIPNLLMCNLLMCNLLINKLAN
ncbi:TPA: transcriptional regulator [Streptococcus pyogenes]